MGWNSWPHWLKGTLVGGVLGIMAGAIFVMIESSKIVALGFVFLPFLAGVIGSFWGMFIGFALGKVKSNWLKGAIIGAVLGIFPGTFVIGSILGPSPGSPALLFYPIISGMLGLCTGLFIGLIVGLIKRIKI